MNCLQFNTIIVNLVCDQLADADERRLALAHAQSCAQCAARLARQQSITTGLSALTAQEQTINAPAHLGAALMAAFEQQQVPVAPKHFQSEPIRFRLFPLMNWRLATAMAAVLIVAGLAAALWQQPIRQDWPVQKENESAAGLTPPLLADSANDGTKLATTVAPKPKRKKTAQYEADQYSELISLMPIAPTDTEEFQQVVSMQIPRSTLRLWGLPFDQESDNEQVSAKVYFSEDGVARAIRLHN